jgi:hypothetical protein
VKENYMDDWQKEMKVRQGFYFKKLIFETAIMVFVLLVGIVVLKWI